MIALDNHVLVRLVTGDDPAQAQRVAAPAGVAVNPAGTRAYVANYNSNTLPVIDTVATVAVGTDGGIRTVERVRIPPCQFNPRG